MDRKGYAIRSVGPPAAASRRRSSHPLAGGSSRPETTRNFPVRLANGINQGLDSTFLGILEVELVQVSLGLVTEGRLDDVFGRWTGDAIDPLEAHLVGREVPDFFVVRDQVKLGEPLAEAAVTGGAATTLGGRLRGWRGQAPRRTPPPPVASPSSSGGG